MKPSNEVLRLGFGYLPITYLFVLALLIALGNVDEAHSFGLHDIIQGFLIFAAAYCGYAFRAHQEATAPKDAEERL